MTYWTLLAYGLAGWISVSLIFTAILARAGWRFNQRRDARNEYNWWMSPCIEGESFPDNAPIIRAKDLI